jgi:predicted DNA-binding transcriptional regulator YafY
VDARSRRVRARLFRAARERRLCRVRYLSSGAPRPSRRTLAPFALVHAAGTWYALARSGPAAGHGEGDDGDHGDAGGDADADGESRGDADGDADGDVRIFRFDRVLEAELLDESFEVPEGFDPSDYMTDGAPYDPHRPVEARVRYSARIAPWIREKGPVDEEAEDGAVVVSHSVSDPDWLVRHVLQYGPEAEVLEPPELRRRVARAAREVARR